MSETDSTRNDPTASPPGSAGSPNSSDIEKAQKGPVDAPPDGGLEAWIVVMGGFCIAFCTFGWITSIGVFQEYYENGPLKHYSSSTIAWIPSLQIFFMMAMGPLVGNIFDKYGPRYLLIVGTFMHVFGLMMASISNEYYQYMLSQGVCSAIGVSAIFQPALNCIPSWFSSRAGLAYGILSTGSSLGGVIFPIMVTRLIPKIGFGWAMRSSAFMILGLLIIANFTVRTRTAPQRAKGTHLTREQLTAPFKEIPFLGLMIGMFLLTFGIYIPLNYIHVQALAAGMRPNLASYLVSMLNAGSLFGRIIAGIAGDKMGKFNTFIVACFFSGFFSLALWIPAGSNQGSIIAFSVLFGFFSGAYISLIGALVAQCCKPQEIGFRTGLIFLVCAVPGLVTNPIAGQIVTNSGSYNGIKIFAGVMMLAGTAFVAATRIKTVGWKLTAVY